MAPLVDHQTMSTGYAVITSCSLRLYFSNSRAAPNNEVLYRVGLLEQNKARAKN